MPYIKAAERRGAKIEGPGNPGELNFVISDIVDSYLIRNGRSYVTLNEVVGVLECAKLELYRRIAAPYEDTKIEENGDVYSPMTKEGTG